MYVYFQYFQSNELITLLQNFISYVYVYTIQFCFIYLLQCAYSNYCFTDIADSVCDKTVARSEGHRCTCDAPP